jgi:hypothetical protein
VAYYHDHMSNAETFQTPAVNEILAYGVTVRNGAKTFAMELEFDRRGAWKLIGGKDLEAAIGREAFGEWLADFWHHNALGQHVWRLGNPTICDRGQLPA